MASENHARFMRSGHFMSTCVNTEYRLCITRVWSRVSSPLCLVAPFYRPKKRTKVYDETSDLPVISLPVIWSRWMSSSKAFWPAAYGRENRMKCEKKNKIKVDLERISQWTKRTRHQWRTYRHVFWTRSAFRCRSKCVLKNHPITIIFVIFYVEYVFTKLQSCTKMSWLP